MNVWPADANNGFHNPQDAAALDTSMFNPNGNIDITQYQNAQLQQRMLNGGVRNASPAFQNPAYQVNPVIPSKRPREDGIAGSPRQGQPNMNISRSQTPQQAGFGFTGQQGGGQQLQAPNPYQHLQQSGSQNATPSPTLQNQQFRPPGTQQRMNTVSPSPYAQAQPGLGMSPQQDQASRVNTPQNQGFPMGGMGYMPNTSMAQGFNQNFAAGPMAATGAGMPPQVTLSQNLAQRQADANRMYQMRLQQQQQQLAASNAAMQQQQQRMQQAGGMNPMLGSTGQHPNLQTPTRPPQQQVPGGAGINTNEQFLKSVATFMQRSNRPFDPNPTVCGRPINLFHLYAYVIKQGKSSKRVTQMNLWPQVAGALGYPPAQFPTAAEEIRRVYEATLAPYETAIAQSQHQQRQRMEQGQGQGQGQMAGIAGDPQMSPTKMMPPSSGIDPQRYLQQQLQHRAQSQQQQGQTGQMTPVQSNANLPTANGFSTPQTDPRQQQQVQNQQRKSMSRPLASPASGQQPQAPGQSPLPPDKPQTDQVTDSKAVQINGIPPVEKADSRERSTNYVPKIRQMDYHGEYSHGGVFVESMSVLGEQISMLKPVVPTLDEMGVIDIRAISLSLQSGIHAEVRCALDHLAKITQEHRVQFELERCEDLIDILIDTGDEQVDALADEAPEVSDILDLTPYEDLVRLSKLEIQGLQDVPECGSPAYELDRAADRLIGVGTILRNLSFLESNHKLLTSSTVMKFLTNTIRLVGTRNLLLRSNVNTQDFMKDILTFLSNTALNMELQSREDAYIILHFLLAFAPSPSPTASETLRFAPYNATVHRYTPHAVDSLAKLLARDDPNRAYYKRLFTDDASSTPNESPHQQYELLTRAFHLAVCVIPDRSSRRIDSQMETRIANARKVTLTQGMLAAEILASLCPGPESSLARVWLESEDGWAPSIVRMCCVLSADNPVRQPPAHARQRGQMQDDDPGFQLIVQRAFGMLKRLGEKWQTEKELLQQKAIIPQYDGTSDERNGRVNGVELKIPDDIINTKDHIAPKPEVLLGAMLTASIDPVAMKQLLGFADMLEKQ